MDKVKQNEAFEARRGRKRSKFLKWLLKPGTLIGLLVFAGLISYNYYENTYILPKTHAAQASISEAVDQFEMAAGDVKTSSSWATKASFTSLSCEYETGLSEAEFKSFYIKNAVQNGWALKKETQRDGYTSWEFLRGEYYMKIGYAVKQKNPTYSVYMKWDYGQKDKGYLLTL